MKLVITETQFDNLNDSLNLKKTFFKYWDRFGGKIDDNFYNLFGFKNKKLDNINEYDVRSYLREWLGHEKSIEITKELILNNPHNVGENFICGGYNFNFYLEIESYSDDLFYVNVLADVKDPEATVDLIMVGGETYQLKDAIDSDDFGWEIETEIEECVYDYISENIINKTGVEVSINSSLYK